MSLNVSGFFGGVGIYYGIQYKSQLVLAINIFVSNNTLTNLLAISLAAGAVLGLFFGLSSLTTSSVSREGKAFWVLASAPISVDTHLISRIFACQVLHFATATIVILLSMIIYVF